MVVLFGDSFEDGTFNAWSSQYTSPGATITVVTTDPYRGIYHGKASVPGSQVGEYARTNKKFNSIYSELYVRGYFKFKTALPSSGNQYEPLAQSTDVNWAAFARAENNAGSVVWGLNYRKNGGYPTLLDTLGPALDTWYCIQLYVKLDAVNGAVKLWIDGSLRLSDSGFNNSDLVGSSSYVHAGERFSQGQTAHDIYFDYIVAADQYIDPIKNPIYVRYMGPGVGASNKIYGVFKGP